MIKNFRCCFGALSVISLLAFTGSALAYTGQRLSGQAKVRIAQAREIALKAHPGTVTDEELERERGGSDLRYSFDIKNGSRTQEVGIDAATGQGTRKQDRRAASGLMRFDARVLDAG